MTTLTDIDKQIADLQAQKRKLVEDEKKTALKKVELALQELNALGFNYRLTEADQAQSRGRRSGVRDSVLNTIKSNPGITSAAIAERLGWTDKSGKQSVANAVSNLRKANQITSEGGKHTAT